MRRAQPMRGRPMPPEIDCLGCVYRVEEKRLHISTLYGNVYCSAKPATGVENSDLTERYKGGNIVNVKARLQERRGQKIYYADKVRLVNKSKTQDDIPFDVEIDQQEITITRVHPTLAYGTHDVCGQVFIPGAAFPPSQQGRLTLRLFVGDKIQAKIRNQKEHNSCKWLAMTGTAKIVNSNGNKIVWGRAQLLHVGKHSAIAWHTESDERVYCPILTWIGGDADNDGESLTDLLKSGEEIAFVGRKTTGENDLRAIQWVRANQQLELDHKKNSFAHVGVQTDPTNKDVFASVISVNDTDEESEPEAHRAKPHKLPDKFNDTDEESEPEAHRAKPHKLPDKVNDIDEELKPEVHRAKPQKLPDKVNATDKKSKPEARRAEPHKVLDKVNEEFFDALTDQKLDEIFKGKNWKADPAVPRK